MRNQACEFHFLFPIFTFNSFLPERNSMPVLTFVFYFLIALGGFCIFINLLLSSFYGNAGLATSDSTDNQSAPSVVRFHLFSFPGISLILFFSGLTGLFLPDFKPVSLLISVLGSFLSGILFAFVAGVTVTGILERIRSKNEGLEAVIRATGTVIEPIKLNIPGKIRVNHGRTEHLADAFEMQHRPVEKGKKVRVTGIHRKNLIVEEIQ